MFVASLLPYPEIDPVLLSVGSFALRWYALAYIAGVMLGYGYIKRLNARVAVLSPKQLEDIMLWAVLGIIVGGRLGYVLFYKPDYYLAHPADIIAIWKGGMSFHGGMVGVIVAFYGFARRYHLPFLRVMDLVAAAAPIGLCLGRLANFINGELIGRPTNVPWAMVFPHLPDAPRHPSQLYQAGLEGALLFVLLAVLVRYGRALSHEGRVSGAFLLGYACFRSFAELFREPDAQLGFLAFGTTMGQLLCLPMAMAGCYLLLRSSKQTS